MSHSRGCMMPNIYIYILCGAQEHDYIRTTEPFIQANDTYMLLAPKLKVMGAEGLLPSCTLLLCKLPFEKRHPNTYTSWQHKGRPLDKSSYSNSCNWMVWGVGTLWDLAAGSDSVVPGGIHPAVLANLRLNSKQLSSSQSSWRGSGM